MTVTWILMNAAEAPSGDTRTLVGVILIIGLALIFDFCNGFHDSANSIATIVSTRVLSPKLAVVWAAFFNFSAAFLVGVGVAKTVANTLAPSVSTNEVIFSALLSAIAWDLITWYLGIPWSSSHALIGGLVGAGLAAGGMSLAVVKWGEVQKPVVGIVLAPTLCLALGFITMWLVLWLSSPFQPKILNPLYRKLQLVSSGIYSISHGGNDAQKTIGVIAALLVSQGHITPKDPVAGLASSDIPWWIIFCAYSAISLGTISGGWRIVKTMGSKITKLRPVDGFAAETAGGVLILAFTALKVPVSTTHSIAGAIMGVGATKRLSAVRWGISANIVWAWILTIPMSALLAVLFYWGTHFTLRLVVGGN